VPQGYLHPSQDQTEGPCPDDSLLAVGDAQLGVDLAIVPFDGVQAEDELVRQLAVGFALRQEGQNVLFALGQRLDVLRTTVIAQLILRLAAAASRDASRAI
jgi:hypothetical protein